MTECGRGPNPQEKAGQQTMEEENRTTSVGGTASIPSENFVDSIRKAAYVIGTALVVFVAARNTITW